MGLFNVSPLDWIGKVMDFSQTSLDNTLGTVKEVHQTLVEIPINIAQELGLPEEKAATLKITHRRILDHALDGVSEACGEVNQYIVKQAEAVNQLANFASNPAKPTIVQLDRPPESGPKTKVS